MTRVLHLIYDDPENPWVAGGGSVRVFELYRRLSPRLGSVTVATGAFPGSGECVREGVRFIRIGSPAPYSWSRLTYGVGATRLLSRAAYDVAIVDFSTYVPLLVPRDRPIGVTVHHITGRRSSAERWGSLVGPLIAWQERLRLRRARVYSATSGATESRLREIVGPGAEIRRVAAGVPDELFALPRRDAGNLLYFGRLDWHQKGLDTLLEAFRIVAERVPSIRLRIAGRGKDAQRLADVAQRLGIASRIELLGAVDERARNELLSSAALLLMPSRFEGFGMVAAEAMAAGVPVIGTTAGSLPEVVDPPQGGVLVEPGNPPALAAEVVRLLSDPVGRERLGRSARESAERFRWQRVAEDHLEFIEAVRASSPVPPERASKTAHR